MFLDIKPYTLMEKILYYKQSATMQAANRLQKALHTGSGRSFGAWQMLPGSNISRIIARSGFDWVAVDTEHGNIDGDGQKDSSRLPIRSNGKHRCGHARGCCSHCRLWCQPAGTNRLEELALVGRTGTRMLIEYLVAANQSWMVKRA